MKHIKSLERLRNILSGPKCLSFHRETFLKSVLKARLCSRPTGRMPCANEPVPQFREIIFQVFFKSRKVTSRAAGGQQRRHLI